MQLLDAVLLKAEKIRAPPQNKPKCPSLPSERPKTSSLSTKSSQKAAKIYKQPTVIAQNCARRVNSNSKSCPKVTANTGQRKKSTSYTKKSAEHPPSTTKAIGGTACLKLLKLCLQLAKKRGIFTRQPFAKVNLREMLIQTPKILLTSSKMGN